MALLKFVEADLPELPVVDPDRPSSVLGLLAREDVFRAYARTLKRLKGTA